MNTQDSREKRIEAPTPPRTLVLGMGETGAACARFFAARGETAAFADTRELPPGLQAIRSAMPRAIVQVGGDGELADSIEQIVVSPGVAMDSGLISAARSRGLRVLSDIDLFMTQARAPVVGITGSNGKSTVTAMLGEALRAAGREVRVGGNLGTPALDLLDPLAEAYVLELSSFQLERSGSLPLEAAVLLNLSPDHLDSHGGLERYAAAKRRIYAACRKAVVNRDAPELAGGIPSTAAVTGFTLGEPDQGDFGLVRRLGREYLACGERRLLAVDDLALQGRHNLANALAVLALGSALGVELKGLLAGLRSFPGLPHRMQLVAEIGGVRWIDDSKATNVGAAIASINAVDGPLVLIAGGDAKGGEFAALAETLAGRELRAAILLGRDRDRLAAALKEVGVTVRVDSMHAAVREASAHIRGSGTVLLAPACSSLDMFASYEARGDAFAAAVRELSA